MKNKLLIIITIFLGLVLISCGGGNGDNPEIEKYTVTFVTNGGSNVNPIEVEKGSLISDDILTERDGFIFKGWYIDINLNEEWKIDQDPVNEDIILYAKWEEVETIKYEVRINNGYGQTQISYTVEVIEGELLEEPETPVREGYTFTGWFTDSDSLYNFNNAVLTNFTITAKWEAIELTVILDLDYDGLTEQHIISYGEQFNIDDPTRDGYIFTGWKYQGQIINKEDYIVTENMILVAKWIIDNGMEGTPISTPAELIQLFQTGGNGIYWLANDLDMTNISFAGSKVEFSGVLDGNGMRISNYHVTASGNKTAAFFGKLMPGAKIKNLTIMNSSIVVPGEGAGFIATYGYGGTTFENLSFVNVDVTQTSSSYAGILFADNQNNTDSETPIEISNILILNNSNNKVSAGQFGGALIGYLRSKTNINIENVYIQTNVDSGEAAGAAAIISRANGATGSTINVNGLVFKGDLDASKEAAVIIGQANSDMNINLENIFINNTNIRTTAGSATEIDLLLARRAAITLYANNIYYTTTTSITRRGNKENITTEATLLQNIDEAWFNSSNFNKQFFKYESGDIMTTIDLGPKVPEGLIVENNSYNNIFVKDIDEELDFTNLSVLLSYTDGTTLKLDSNSYTLNTSEFDPTQSGDYKIYVSYESYTAHFNIRVVEIDQLLIHTYTQKIVFKAGDTINKNLFGNIVVNALLTNGERILLNEEDYIFDLTGVINREGSYQVEVIYKDNFKQTFNITIVNNFLTPINNKVEIVVDTNTENSGTIINGLLTVKTIKEAFNILESSSLSSSVIKKVLIKEGTYFEKLTLNIPNVHLIGENQETTIIDYNMANGSLTPLLSIWGTQGSATFTLGSNATGFIATNLTFSNSFDYYGSNISGKQAVAIVVQADKSIFYKVSFLGLQDTLYAKDGRQWYLDVYVEGIVDYIFGNGGPAYFENSEIHTLQRQGTSAEGVITAQKGLGADGKTMIGIGYVFYNNRFTAPSGMTTPIVLGRPWDKDAYVSYVNNQFHEKMSPVGWVDMSGNKPENARFYEYGNKIGETPFMSTVGKELTESEALNLSNKDYVFAQVNGAINFGSSWDWQAQLNLILEN